MKEQKVAAVICEFDPFHAGHAALFKQLRALEGEDVAIIAIMSGNFTQRGEAALFPKQVRAICAIRGGADLVLELPFPYSCSGAERFATAGVYIAKAIGNVDVLFFGSECGDITKLSRLAYQLETSTFLHAYQMLSANAAIGCAKKTEVAYRTIYGNNASEMLQLLQGPNNVLGVEYLRALIREKSTIRPLALSRVGMQHGDDNWLSSQVITSASAARRGFLQEKDYRVILEKLPSSIIDIIQTAVARGEILADRTQLLAYSLLYYRNCKKQELMQCDGMKSGLGNRILHAAQENNTPEAFFSALRSKRYTDAYLRRALLYGMFGITRTQLNGHPTYTQILAMTKRGQDVLANIRKSASIPILNRPSEIHHLPKETFLLAENSIRADSVYCAFLKQPSCPSDQFRYSPYREKR